MSTAPALTPPPAAPLDAWGQVVALVQDGFGWLREPRWTLRRVMVWELWLVATVGDAGSTLLALEDRSLEEGNPAAGLGMGLLGPATYVFLASLVCFLMAVVCAGRPQGRVARVARWCLMLVAVAKIGMTYHNLLLWQAG